MPLRFHTCVLSALSIAHPSSLTTLILMPSSVSFSLHRPRCGNTHGLGSRAAHHHHHHSSTLKLIVPFFAAPT